MIVGGLLQCDGCYRKKPGQIKIDDDGLKGFGGAGVADFKY